MQENPFSLRLESGIMAKLKVMAKANSRSVNKEIEYAVKEQIKTYEKENGPIAVDKE